MAAARSDLRVALLTNILPPYRLAFYNALARLVDLTVVVNALTTPDRSWSVDPHSFEFRLEVAGGIPARVVRSGAGGHSEDRFVHLADRSMRILQRLRPHVIVTGELGLRTAQAIIYGKWSGAPVICYWEGTDHTEARVSRARRLWRQALLRGVDAAWVNGSESEQYLARLGTSRAMMTSAMTGVDTEYFWRESARSQACRWARREHLGVRGLVLAFSGALSARKGIGPYLQACHQLLSRHPGIDCSLLFIGDGACRPMIEAWRESHPSVPVKITGFVQLPELPALYACADWFVLPTLEDCWALATVEPLVCGIPQVFSKYNGASADLARIEGAGIVADPLAVESMQAALLQAVREGPRRVPDSSAQYARAMYNSEAQAERGLRSIQQLVSARKRR